MVPAPEVGAVEGLLGVVTTARMEKDQLSTRNRELFYNQVLAALDTRIQKAAEAKERKIMQNVRNRIYIREQEEKIYR